LAASRAFDAQRDVLAPGGRCAQNHGASHGG
jgi:hypothetical protein